MSAFPIPQVTAGSVYDLTPELFLRRGVEAVLLDLDNTLAPYSQHQAPPALRNWIDRLRAAGLTPFLLSNNRGERPAEFARALDIGYAKRAGKPGTAALFRVLKELGKTPEQAALVGDQVYTDVLCARRAGVLAVLVRPISMKNPLLALRYGAEAPFRLLARGRAERIGKCTEAKP